MIKVWVISKVLKYPFPAKTQRVKGPEWRMWHATRNTSAHQINPNSPKHQNLCDLWFTFFKLGAFEKWFFDIFVDTQAAINKIQPARPAPTTSISLRIHPPTRINSPIAPLPPSHSCQPPKRTPYHEWWAMSMPSVDLTGEWTLIVDYIRGK